VSGGLELGRSIDGFPFRHIFGIWYRIYPETSRVLSLRLSAHRLSPCLRPHCSTHSSHPHAPSAAAPWLELPAASAALNAAGDNADDHAAIGRRQPEAAARSAPSGLVTLDRRARGTEFLAVSARSVLNSPAATHMPFWSLNPYVGCEFGCTYCYARDTHRYLVERMGGQVETLPAWEAFERRVIVKLDVAAVLARTLDPARLAGSSLVIGTATDPYQPAERKFRLTRRVLEALLAYRGLSIGLITKSPLVTRDLDVLCRLSQRHHLEVNISLATLDRRLARRLELRSPVPAARLRALAKLVRGGVRAGLLVAPIVPCVTDSRAALDALFRAAREAGARYVVGSALRLGPAARHRFLPHLAQEFPHLAERYAQHYRSRTSASRQYQDALARRLRALRR
jgi:DNA repair photolyase